jgi:hypothetical protein
MAVPVAHGPTEGPATKIAGILAYVPPTTGMPLPVTVLTPALNPSETTILTDLIVSLEGEGFRVTPTGVVAAKRIATPWAGESRNKDRVSTMPWRLVAAVNGLRTLWILLSSLFGKKKEKKKMARKTTKSVVEITFGV